jgi:hypothetical protein
LLTRPKPLSKLRYIPNTRHYSAHSGWKILGEWSRKWIFHVVPLVTEQFLFTHSLYYSLTKITTLSSTEHNFLDKGITFFSNVQYHSYIQ